MTLILTIENETSLPNGAPVSVRISDKRNLDIGRGAHLDWPLPDPSRFISGKHCEVRYREDAYWLYDVSTNGTFLNDNTRRIESPYKLCDGDRLAIGSYIISVKIEEDPPKYDFEALPSEPAQEAEDQPSQAEAAAAEPIAAAPFAEEDRSFEAHPLEAYSSARDSDSSALDSDDARLVDDQRAAASSSEEEVAGDYACDAPAEEAHLRSAGEPGALAGPKFLVEPDAAIAADTSSIESAAPPSTTFAGQAQTSGEATIEPAEEQFEEPAAVETAAAEALHPVGADPLPFLLREPVENERPEPAFRSMPRVSEVADYFDLRKASASEPTPAPVPLTPTPAISSREKLPPPRLPKAETPELQTAKEANPEKTSVTLDEFIQHFAAAAGIPAQIFDRQDKLKTADDLGYLILLAVSSLKQLLSARDSAKRFARTSNRTVVQAFDNNPLKFAPTPEDALKIMFGPKTSGYLDARRALEGAFGDLKTHQIKTFSAMQNAVKMLVEDLNPEEIDASMAPEKGLFALLSSRKSRLWDLYLARWQAKTLRHDDGMVDAFMLYFAECYDQKND